MREMGRKGRGREGMYRLHTALYLQNNRDTGHATENLSNLRPSPSFMVLKQSTRWLCTMRGN